MERIGLDQPTLKALAGETRVRMLKLLDAKPLTQSDIAQAMKLSTPSVAEHLQALARAGLVAREETSRKWKYYSLTQKSRMLLHPNTTTIWFILGLFLFSAAATVMSAMQYFTPVAQPVAEAKMFAFPAQQSLALASSAPLVEAASPFWLIAFGVVTAALLVALVLSLQKHGWLGKSLTNKKNI